MQPYYDPYRGWVYPERNQRQAPQMNSIQEELESLKKRIQEIEYGTPNNYDNRPVQSRSVPEKSVQTNDRVNATEKPAIISVNSEDEVTRFELDQVQMMMKEKFIFRNKGSGEFYEKYWDAMRQEMVQDTFQRVPKITTEEIVKEADKISLTDIAIKIEKVESQLSKLMGFVDIFMATKQSEPEASP